MAARGGRRRRRVQPCGRTGSSWFNNGTGTSYSSVVVHTDNNYGGNSFCLDKGWGNTWDSVANDQGEANRWINGPC